MKNPIKKIIVSSASTYRKFPVKPFRKFFLSFYLKHLEPKMPENKFVIAKVGGINYRVSLANLMGVETYYGGGYEPLVSEMIDRYVGPGMTALDIGANVGLHTCRMAKAVGRDGRVIAFDPNEEVLKELNYNIQLNNFRNVAVINAAISEECPFDKYVKDKINFIKIDTDGYECKIIKGGAESIKNFKPIIVIEFCSYTLAEQGNKIEDLIDLLDSLDYSLFLKAGQKIPQSKESLLAIFESSPRVTVNVLCLPKR